MGSCAGVSVKDLAVFVGVKIDGQAVAPKSYNVDPELFHSGTALQSGNKRWAKLV